MRHGLRGKEVDAPLSTYSARDLEASCPEVWASVHQLASLDLREIITSPYLRTRQTAIIVQYGLMKLTGRLLPLTVDLRIGEWIGPLSRRKLPTQSDFDPDTWKWYKGMVPLGRESSEMLKMRVQQFAMTVSRNALVITHNGVAGLLGLCHRQSVGLRMGEWRVLGEEAAVVEAARG